MLRVCASVGNDPDDIGDRVDLLARGVLQSDLDLDAPMRRRVEFEQRLGKRRPG